jgi:flagellar biosynthesis GTPase FlhF
MSLRIAPRKMASSALPRPSHYECPLRSQRSSKCAFSTTQPSNRRPRIPSPVDFVKPGEKPAKMTITLTTPEQSAEIEKSLIEKATKIAQEREEKLRQARSARLGKLSADAKKSPEARANMAPSERRTGWAEYDRREKAKQVEERTNEAEEKKKTGLTKEEREKAEKEDYKRRYKQLERNWLKFMVGMPIFLVTSYDLFQRRKLCLFEGRRGYANMA